MFSRASTCGRFSACAQERLVYRGDFALGTLMRFLPIVTQIFLWYAVFAARDGKPLAGFRYEDFVAYYLLTMVARAFSSMPGLASGIAAQIRSGEIKKFLIQPIDLLSFLLLGRIAHKLAYYGRHRCRLRWSFLPRLLSGWPSRLRLAVLSLVLALSLGFFLEACMGLVGFWSGSQLAVVCVYALQLLPVRTHVSARHAARALEMRR
jgi:ABC-2 type transport system permease protein